MQDIVAELRAAGCVFAEDEAAMLIDAADTADRLAAMLRRRIDGEPLEQVVGWASFCGLRIAVQPGVFVPRRRTEALAREAVALARVAAIARVPVVVDLCCGTGALAAAVREEVGTVELYACDIEPAAVDCARENLGTSATVLLGDLDAPLPGDLRGRVDVLVANVPYVPTDEIALLPPEARLFEPRVTLDGGADGLAVLRRVAQAAPRWLAAGGSMLCETSERQAATALDTIAAQGLATRLVVDEHLDAAVVVGTLPR